MERDYIPYNVTESHLNPSYIRSSTISGGNIDTSSSLFYWVVCAILIIVICWLIYLIFQKVKIAGEDYNQRQTRIHFNNIHGEHNDDEAKQAIYYGELIENPRAIDHYRMGTIYLLNAQNPEAAHRHFENALQQVINGQVDNREAPFILNRITDFADLYIDLPDGENDLPIQQAMLAHFDNQLAQLQHISKPHKHIDPNDPEFKQKTIISRQNWQPDSQNVHDSAVYKELQEQVREVIRENKLITNVDLHNYDEALNWMHVRYRDSPKKDDIDKVLAVVSENNPIGVLHGMIGERDLVTAIWQRSYDPSNQKNAVSIREALADALCDCVEGGHVVCVTGRSAKIWQSLARLDKCEYMGIFKTKQILRNEIYDRAAKVIDDFIGVDGSASQSLILAYNNDQETEQVIELKNHMRDKIAEIADEYKGLLDDTQLTLIIAECQAIV